MLIDWFTVGAQLVNFFILVWLMKRFLYKPILNAIDKREKRISEEIANADKKKTEAQKESDEFKNKNEEFDQQRATLLKKATDEVKDERQRLLEEARKAADVLSAKRQETMRNDAHNLHQAISKRIQKEVFAISRKTLNDLASTNLEKSMSEMFTRNLREMDDPAKAQLADTIKTTSDPVLVRSAFELPDEQRVAIQKAFNETFSADIDIQFETGADFICGIELTTNGQKLAWSIDDYLKSMENGVDELLKEKYKIETKAKTKIEESKPEIKDNPEVEAKTEQKSEAKVQSKSDTKTEPKPEVYPKPEKKNK